MLASFRNASQTWYVKLLFALLILSFGVWGIGDVIRGRVESQPAIVVGDQDIPANEVVDAFRRETDRLSALTGGKITAEQARQAGLMQRVIQQMVSGALIEQAARKLGLQVDDETMRKTIASIPAFQNELHVFDKNIYQRQLARAGMTERSFLARERQDLDREQVMRLVAEGLKAPAAMADSAFRYRMEQRVADTVIYRNDRVPAPADPGEGALRQYHKDHATQFMQPELRGVSAIVVRSADVAGDIKPSDADVQKSYQIRQAEFQVPEKRAIQQVLLTDQAKAQAFADQVKQGKDFGLTAKTAGTEVTDLGMVERKDVPLPALADAAFGLQGTGIAGPVQSPLGWHVLRVSSVIPGKTRSLADVRDQIVKGLVKDEATNRLYALSTKLEDAIGSGAGIEEAANTVNLKPVKLAAVDAQGNGPDGKPVAGGTLPPDVLGQAFQLSQGSTGEVNQLADGDGYYVVRVDSVSPPQLKPFESVKNQVLAAWSSEQRGKVTRQQADAAAERAKSGIPLATVAAPLKVETTKPFTRAVDEDANLAPALAAEMFKLQPGGVAVVPVKDGVMLAQLKSIIPADPKAQSAQYEALRAQLTQTLGGDMLTQYVSALEKDYGVRVNNAVIEQQFQR